jgi:hypothetical protein
MVLARRTLGIVALATIVCAKQANALHCHIVTRFNMNATVGAESAANITATVPAGQVGLWASDSSGSSFDDFGAKDAAGPYEIDGRWFTNRGEARAWT